MTGIGDDSVFHANMDTINKRGSASDFVIKNIKNLILSKSIKPGDKLPNETELSKSFGVSRGTIREAMKILSTHGIIEIRRGDGTYICDSNSGIPFDPLVFKLIMDYEDLDDIKELREMIELGIINLAINNHLDEDIDKLENAYKYMEQKYLQENILDDDIVKCELMFHNALGQATRNKMAHTIYKVILDLYIPNVYRGMQAQRTVKEALECHRPIIDAIVEKDIVKGEEAIKYSVDIWKLQSMNYKINQI